MAREVFNAKEVADMLGVSDRTISRHIEDGKLSASRPGRSYVITLNDLGDYLGNRDRARVVVEAYLKRKGTLNGAGQ